MDNLIHIPLSKDMIITFLKEIPSFREYLGELIYNNVFDKNNYYRPIIQFIQKFGVRLTADEWDKIFDKCDKIFLDRDTFIKNYVKHPLNRTGLKRLQLYLDGKLDRYYFNRMVNTMETVLRTSDVNWTKEYENLRPLLENPQRLYIILQ